MIALLEKMAKAVKRDTITEGELGEKGKERVRKFLHKMVDKYVNFLEEASEDTDNGFYVGDFTKWFKEQD
jgi:hypothetical protein